MALWLAVAVADAGQRVNPDPGALSLLAESLLDAEPDLRREFADALLAVLIETYEDELDRAGGERPRDGHRAIKLRRWRAAIGTLTADLRASRLRLAEGAELALRIDARRQVLLFIDDRAIAFAAPRPGTERLAEEGVVARFCARNDCRILDGLVAGVRDTRPPPVLGQWAFTAGHSPAYEIRGVVRCGFGDIAGRAAKEQACRDLAKDALTLAEGMAAAQHRGHIVDWRHVETTTILPVPDLRVTINAARDYIDLQAPALSRLDAAAWRDCLRWLRARVSADDAAPMRVDGDALLHATGASNHR